MRAYSSEEGDFERCILGNMDQRLPFEVKYLSKEKGANRWVWNLRRDGLACIEDIRLFEGFSGALVKPGKYVVSAAIGDARDTVELTLLPDRRIEATAEEYAEVERRIGQTTDLVNQLLAGVAAIRKSRAQIERLLADYPDADELQETGRRAVERLSAWERKVYQVEFETYEDEDNLPPRLIKQVRHLLDVIDGGGPPLAAGALERLGDLEAEWAALRNELSEIEASDIKAVNEWAKSQSVPHVAPPALGGPFSSEVPPE